MLQHLKPAEADIEKLALAETDPHRPAQFAPLRWGPAGNLLVIAAAGGLGHVHAALASAWRRVFSSARNGSA